MSCAYCYCIWETIWQCVDSPVKSNPWTGHEDSRRLTLPDLMTVDTWRCQGCQPFTPATFTPRKYSWYSFLLQANRPQSHSVAGKIKSMKNSNDIFENWTRNLLACSTVPQPTAPPRSWKFSTFPDKPLPFHSCWSDDSNIQEVWKIHLAPHYTVFFSLLPLSLSYAHGVSSAPCFQVSQVCHTQTICLQSL